MAHDQYFLCLVDPAGQDVSLPQNGERCKISISNVEIPMSKNLLKEHGHRLADVITESLTERDRISAINKKAAHFFGRDMSQDELNELVPNSDESDYLDRAKWLKRVVEWALEHEDLFAKPYEPSKDEPSEDDPRWFSAYRIEFPSA
jgi:hypothetical protein